MQMYDIIGDIHGHADALVALLVMLNYQESNGAWRHPDRKAIFVGDFVDLVPKQVQTVMLVKKMVESDAALAVLGNHDLNAIAWHLPDPANPSDYLRSHFSKEWGEKYRHQHSAFLAAVENHPELHRGSKSSIGPRSFAQHRLRSRHLRPNAATVRAGRVLHSLPVAAEPCLQRRPRSDC